MRNSTITFIGGGNMARCLIGGLVANDVPAERLRIADVQKTPLAAGNFPVQIYADNREAMTGADVVVLAVKPQVLPEVCKDLAAAIDPKNAPLFISIAAGVRSDAILRWLGAETLPVVRVMPNTPALVQSGASALFASATVSKVQHELAENILRAVGMTLWVEDENLMDSVTALSGSGPAYFFLLLEVLENAAIDLGLKAEDARLLTLQTAFGAAKMALESSEDAATLRARVTSKGGTTEQALKVLEDNQALQDLFSRALQAAHARSAELAKQLGEL
jgi:pyrroline-5-carboxylate reductase